MTMPNIIRLMAEDDWFSLYVETPEHIICIWAVPIDAQTQQTQLLDDPFQEAAKRYVKRFAQHPETRPQLVDIQLRNWLVIPA